MNPNVLDARKTSQLNPVAKTPAPKTARLRKQSVLNLYHYFREFPADAKSINGGIEKAVAGLAAGLVQDPDLRCTVLCEGEGAADFLRPEGFRVRRFDNASTRTTRFALAPSLRDFVVTDLEPDSLVVLHAMLHASCHMMSRLLQKRGIRYIVAPHDPYHPSVFASGRLKKAIYWRLFERPMLARAAAVQLLDARHERFLRDRGIRTPVIEVANGFVPQEVPVESSLTWRTSGPIRILYLGRLDPINKGLDLLLDAFAEVAAQRTTARLTLQGRDDGEGDFVRTRIRQRGLSERVEMLPPDFKLFASEIAAQHDLLVLPSRFEGFGLSAMEAMLAARPVLISEIAGLAPYVRKSGGGVVVDATVASIRDGIEQLISRRDQWQQIGLRGRQYVLENLTWSKIASGALRDYRAVAATTAAES